MNLIGSIYRSQKYDSGQEISKLRGAKIRKTGPFCEISLNPYNEEIKNKLNFITMGFC